MPRHKKILVSLPDSLLLEADSLATQQNVNRSELIRNAMRQYITYSKKQNLTQQMKKGYEQMAGINLEISEYCVSADNKTQQFYEEKLAECE